MCQNAEVSNAVLPSTPGSYYCAPEEAAVMALVLGSCYSWQIFRLSPRLLASAWPKLGFYRRLGSEPVFASFLSAFDLFCLFGFQIHVTRKFLKCDKILYSLFINYTTQSGVNRKNVLVSSRRLESTVGSITGCEAAL